MKIHAEFFARVGEGLLGLSASGKGMYYGKVTIAIILTLISLLISHDFPWDPRGKNVELRYWNKKTKN